jgi:hypothetical protein
MSDNNIRNEESIDETESVIATETDEKTEKWQNGSNSPNPTESDDVTIAKLNYKREISIIIISSLTTLFLTLISTGKLSLPQGKQFEPDIRQISVDNTKQNEKDVIMIGSGTVYRFLREFDIIKSLDDNLHVQTLEGATDTGVTLFKSAFKDNNIIVMSSKKLTIEDFIKSDPNSNFSKESNSNNQTESNKIQYENKTVPNNIFEIYLGADSLQMLLLSGKKTTKENPDSPELAFKNILSASSSNNVKFEDLITKGSWFQSDYNVFIGSKGSATNEHWEKGIKAVNGNWNNDFRVLDIQNPEVFNNDPTKLEKPFIYLGRKILNETFVSNLKKDLINPPIELNMFYGSNPAKHGLYLYGILSEKPELLKNEEGFMIPDKVVKTLYEILTLLRNNKEQSKSKSEMLRMFEVDCIDKQLNNFNLNEKVEKRGWVSAVSGKNHIFRIETCKEKPNE